MGQVSGRRAPGRSSRACGDEAHGACAMRRLSLRLAQPLTEWNQRSKDCWNVEPTTASAGFLLDSALFYELVSRVGRALASPERLLLIDLLTQGDRTVEVLAQAAEQPVRTTSHHLQELKAARLVVARKSGRHVVYSLADPSVLRFWCDLREFAHDRSPELREAALALAQRRKLVDIETLQSMLQSSRVALLDVRPAEEFKAGHLPTARSIPLPELVSRVDELPKSRVVVAYCRGPHCLMADHAVDILTEHGLRARRLDAGIAEWIAAGLPLETGPN